MKNDISQAIQTVGLDPKEFELEDEGDEAPNTNGRRRVSLLTAFYLRQERRASGQPAISPETRRRQGQLSHLGQLRCAKPALLIGSWPCRVSICSESP
jgi:hypothetical protein